MNKKLADHSGGVGLVLTLLSFFIKGILCTISISIGIILLVIRFVYYKEYVKAVLVFLAGLYLLFSVTHSI